MKQNGKELKVSSNMEGNRDAILVQIQSMLEAAGEEELEWFLIFLDTYLRKKTKKRAGR
ncbi:MAG: hypothetical protein ACI4PL_08885 [Faecousia sp.]